MTKPIPKVYATRFFQLVTSRQFAEAERILERVKQKMYVSERNRGYFQALYGILLAQKSNDDRYAFLSNLDLSNKKQLKDLRKGFQGHVESRLHAEYDRGFFEAWVDYMKVLPKLEVSVSPALGKSFIGTDKGKEDEASIEAEEETVDRTSTEGRGRAEIEQEEKPVEKKAEMELAERRQSTLSDYA